MTSLEGPACHFWNNIIALDDTFPNPLPYLGRLPKWNLRHAFFCKIHVRLILTTENKHDNGNSNIWRCISYWEMRISQCDMSFQGLYPNKTGVVSGANWNLEEPFWIQQEVHPKTTSFPSCCIFFFGKNDFEVEKNIKPPPFCWVDKQTLSMKAKDWDSESILHPFLGWDNSPDAGFYRHFWRSLWFPGVPDPPKHKNITIQGVLTITPPKFNMAPEKWWLEDEFPFGIAYF